MTSHRAGGALMYSLVILCLIPCSAVAGLVQNSLNWVADTVAELPRSIPLVDSPRVLQVSLHSLNEKGLAEIRETEATASPFPVNEATAPAPALLPVAQVAQVERALSANEWVSPVQVAHEPDGQTSAIPMSWLAAGISALFAALICSILGLRFLQNDRLPASYWLQQVRVGPFGKVRPDVVVAKTPSAVSFEKKAKPPVPRPPKPQVNRPIPRHEVTPLTRAKYSVLVKNGTHRHSG